MTYFAPGGGIAVSRQFQNNQTDVFSVDENGRLNVSWVVANGAWQGPMIISAASFIPGCLLAASQQFGAAQTDVVIIDKNGQLNVFSTVGDNVWNGPALVGPAGIAAPGSAFGLSRQGTANQLDICLIDHNGQLNVLSVTDQGAWQGPFTVGLEGFANPGSFVIALPQIGTNQTDAFVVDKNGQLNVFTVTGEGTWTGPIPIGPTHLAVAGCPLAASQQFGSDQTDVLLVGANGQLNVFAVVGGGTWGGPYPIGSAGAFSSWTLLAAGQRIGSNETEVYLVDKTGQLMSYAVQSGGSWEPTPIASGISNAGVSVCASQQFDLNQTDVFVLDKNGLLTFFWTVGQGSWSGPGVRGEPVAAPSTGLGGSVNYFMQSLSSGTTSGTNLTGVSIAVDVTLDMVIEANGLPQPPLQQISGFSVQLNCYSLSNSTVTTILQQYVLSFTESNLVAQVNNWNSQIYVNNLTTPVINSSTNLMALTGSKIPAGYQLQISLQNDSSGNVSAAVFSVSLNGKQLASKTLTLTTLTNLITNKLVTSADLAPIVAYDLDIVGPGNGESVTFSSGAGLIVYSGEQPLTVSLALPSNAAGGGEGTEEKSNASYGLLSSTPSPQFTQTFYSSNITPMITREGKVRLVRPVPQS